MLDLFDKLRILSDAAKYDAACTSSGVDRDGKGGQPQLFSRRALHFFIEGFNEQRLHL